MIHELAEFQIKSDSYAAFEAAVQEAMPLFKRAKGCVSMRLDRVIERPGFYHLVIGWKTLENHTVDFRGSADFQTLLGLIDHHLAGTPSVEHMENVIAGFSA